MRLVLLALCSLLAVAWADEYMCPRYIQRHWGEVVSHHLAHVHTFYACKHACLCTPWILQTLNVRHSVSLNFHLALGG